MVDENPVLTMCELRLHAAAADLLCGIKDDAFKLITDAISEGRRLSEFDVKDYITRRYAEAGLVSSGMPVVAFGEGTREPHHAARNDEFIGPDTLVLVDVFAKVDEESGIYADMTWMGYTGEKIPSKYADAFAIIAGARDAVLEKLRRSFVEGIPVRGFELDDAARCFITERGLGGFFTHRTGHSLGRELVGEGVCPDNYKMKDERVVVSGSCFTVEPGVYLRDFGVRTEVDVYVSEEGMNVSTGIQNEIRRLI
ncbi:MAG: M24 family metallopeptidase [Candidatus Altiarchaeota archaeon]